MKLSQLINMKLSTLRDNSSEGMKYEVLQYYHQNPALYGDQIMLNTQLINEKYQFNHMSLKMSVQILLDQNIIGQAMVSSSESVC